MVDVCAYKLTFWKIYALWIFEFYVVFVEILFVTTLLWDAISCLSRSKLCFWFPIKSDWIEICAIISFKSVSWNAARSKSTMKNGKCLRFHNRSPGARLIKGLKGRRLVFLGVFCIRPHNLSIMQTLFMSYTASCAIFVISKTYGCCSSFVLTIYVSSASLAILNTAINFPTSTTQ